MRQHLMLYVLTVAFIVLVRSTTVVAQYQDDKNRGNDMWTLSSTPHVETRSPSTSKYSSAPTWNNGYLGYGGGLCVTSRGACPVGPVKSGAPCHCNIAGFGNKRGAVQ